MQRTEKERTMRDTIVFELTAYPVIRAVVDGFCNNETVVIATESLMEKLHADDGDCVSEKAEAIDEGIFYYVPDRVMDLAEAEVVKFVMEHIV